MQQSQVLPTEGFISMSNTRFAWSMAFPSVYQPSYVNFRGEWQWLIFNDITGSNFTRDQKADINRWVEHQSWRSDGIPSAHPTWSIVVYNTRMQLKLQKQGSFVLSNTEVDPTVTIDEIKNAASTDELKKVVKRMLKTARMHASNIPGTTPYWHSIRFEMRAIHFFNAYMKNHHMCIVHTGSLAEYHEPALRLLLSKYVQKIPAVKGDAPTSSLVIQPINCNKTGQ